MISKYSAFIRILAIGLMLLIYGCQNSDSEEKTTSTGIKVAEPPIVKVVRVKRADISVPLVATGTIFPEYESKIGPKISGTIEIVYVDEGDKVQKGQPLVQLDQKNWLIVVRQGQAAVRVAEAQLKEAEAKVENLKKEKKRLANLLKKNVISQQKYENLAMAEQKLSDTVIIAPFSGLVVKRFINQGEYVSTMPPSPLFLIMNIDKVKAEISLPEIHIARIHIGNPVEVTVDTYPGIIFRGKVSTINPMVDPVSRAFIVKVEIPNKDHRLKFGMFARVTIYPKIHKDALIVPFKSVMKRAGTTVVFVIDGNRVRLRAVTAGITNEREIEVIDGLKEGEEVVIEGHYGMADKTKVRVERE